MSTLARPLSVAALLLGLAAGVRADFDNHAKSSAEISIAYGTGPGAVATTGVAHPAVIFPDTFGEDPLKVEDPFRVTGSAFAMVSYLPPDAGYLGDRLGWRR